MQDYVPYYFGGKNKERNKKRVISIVLAVVFVAAILSIVFAVAIKPKSDAYLKEIKFYFVYTNKSVKQNSLADEKLLIEKLGGSGVMLLHDNHYYLIANVYFSKEEAEEIKENINKNFPNSGIITLTKTLTGAQKRQIKSNEVATECFRFMRGFLTELHDNSMKYVAGSISEASLNNKIMAGRLELEELIKKGSENSEELSQKIKVYENLCNEYIKNFFEVFFLEDKKQMALSKLVVNLALSYCNLIDNL